MRADLLSVLWWIAVISLLEFAAFVVWCLFEWLRQK